MTRARKPKAAPIAAGPAWPRVWNGGPAQPIGEPAIVLAFEVATSNEANGTTQRWAKIHRREKAREATIEALTLLGAPVVALADAGGPWCVRITRLSVSRLDDDAVGLATKTIRDTIAAALRVDDGSPAIAFAYAQAKGGPPGVRVEVWDASGCPS